MVDHHQYAKTARTFGLILNLVQDNHYGRELVLENVREAMAEFRKENSIFNPKLFAATVAQTAFPHDETRHPQLIVELLNEKP